MAIERFEITLGSPKGFTKKGDSGNELTRYFCPDCGSPLFTSSPRHPDFVYVKAGAFDDPTLVHPAHQSWTRSSVPCATRPQRGGVGFSRGLEDLRSVSGETHESKLLRQWRKFFRLALDDCRLDVNNMRLVSRWWRRS